jgi:uncharacterized membrane protein
MQRSNRFWWIAGAVIAIAILFLLASIARRSSFSSPGPELAPGESEQLRARVVKVLEEGMVDQGGFEQPYQRLRLELTEGPLQGQTVDVDYGQLGFSNESRLFGPGDRVIVERIRSADQTDLYLITDYVRTTPLLWLTLIFVAATLLLSGWQGARSLVGMGISLIVIVAFIVPQILAGRDPVLIAVTGSIVMMGISLYLVYGWHRKTHVAIVGLLLSLVLAGLLSIWFVNWSRLSGYGAEEAGFLQVAGVQLDPRGLLLAGIIIGSLGALDDVAIGQASSIHELSRANPQLGWRGLFAHGMTIGRDHLAAMVNTLFLAYVGAALPFLLLFSVYTEPLGMTLNREIIAEEIVRTLVGSLGLLAGVPFTSIVAAIAFSRGHRELSGEPAEGET